MSAAPLLLSTPPFPGLAPGSFALDAGPFKGGGDVDVGLKAARAMAEARVGGNFWGAQVKSRARLIVPDDAMLLPEGPLDDAVVMTRRRAGDASARGALVVPPDVDPWPLIEGASVVLASPAGKLGLLAAAAGRRLEACDGTLVTDDGGRRVATALIGRRYRDPFTGAEINAVAAIALLAFWRGIVDANRGLAVGAGIAFWKRPEFARLMWDGRGDALPLRNAGAALDRAARRGGAVAAWPARVPHDFAQRAEERGVSVRWVEDGFLRSAGLGSDLLPPLSLTVDPLWPYFDPARPSALETMLEAGVAEPALLARARGLREVIVARRIGKYRVGGDAGDLPNVPAAARLVVVVGQVEDDLSMLRGGAGMTNRLLIERARIAEPDAFIIYRPHPDVEAGHRRGAVADSVVLFYADGIDRGGSLDALLARAEALHTITSLTGFEALLRGVRVVVHGQPFYAGWGLTHDCAPRIARRTRRLTLDELVACALIRYPRYLHPGTGLPCTPEQFIRGFGGEAGGSRLGGLLVRVRRWQGQLRRLFG